MISEIVDYNAKQALGDQAICVLLESIIRSVLTEAESKLWHGSPVWFLDGNPIVGYHKLKSGIRLLFWSGQSFEETDLKTEGTFKAAGKLYSSLDEVDVDAVRTWLTQSRDIQWDYKNIVKRKGELLRLK